MHKIKLQANEILVLHTNDKNNRAYGDFQYPEKGIVTALDWDGRAKCGGGLHGLPRGCGDGSLLNWSNDAFVLLLKVNTEKYVEFDGKCKFESADVIFCKQGGMTDAVAILCAVYPDAPIVGRTATAGYKGTATAGDYGTATAGDKGTATAGYKGIATAGNEGTATAGNEGILIITHWDEVANRWRKAIASVGENGIEPNKKYRLSSDNKFVEAE